MTSVLHEHEKKWHDAPNVVEVFASLGVEI
jgi:hypothetical protein